MVRNMRRMEFLDQEPEEDGGVDLTLRLSIGGSSRRATNPAPARHGCDKRSGSGEAVAALGRGLPFDGADPFRQRETWKNGIFGGGNGVPAEDQAALEAQALESRARDRAARERDAFAAERWSSVRKGRQSDGRIAGVAWSPSPNPNKPDAVAYGQHPLPAMAMPYPYYQVQDVPVPNGLGLPFVVPCWSPAQGSTHDERNVVQPVARRSLPVSVSAVVADGGIGGGCFLDTKGGNGIGVNGAPSLIDSLRSSPSGVLDQRSTGSLRGSSISSGARSQSTHTMPEKPGLFSSEVLSNPQRHESPNVASPSQGTEEGTEKIIASPEGSSLALNSATSAMGKLDGATSEDKPISTADDQNSNDSSSLPRMPVVSTKGDGPNGKTVFGFLYRYTKSEVSIVCVCHGSSFSPAAFVRHAGGTDTSHPLRQILVVPR